MTQPEVSLVIPCHNEEQNLSPLLSSIHAALDPLNLNYEVVITDDCSSDDSWNILRALAVSDPRLSVQRFKFNCGESAASWAGMQKARGRYIATLDADLQNDPKDLPVMMDALKQADCMNFPLIIALTWVGQEHRHSAGSGWHSGLSAEHNCLSSQFDVNPKKKACFHRGRSLAGTAGNELAELLIRTFVPVGWRFFWSRAAPGSSP